MLREKKWEERWNLWKKQKKEKEEKRDKERKKWNRIWFEKYNNEKEALKARVGKLEEEVEQLKEAKGVNRDNEELEVIRREYKWHIKIGELKRGRKVGGR